MLPHLVFYIVPWQAVEPSAIATMRRRWKVSFWDGGMCFKSRRFPKLDFDFDSDSFTIMAYCLPSNLENFIPPPFEQRSQPPPWRGSFVVRGANSDRTITQKIFVTAVETDGEKYVDPAMFQKRNIYWIHHHPSRASHWPDTFYVRVVHERPVLRDVQAWVKECVPPLPICTFMPNRLRDQNANAVNQTNFRSLSRILFENQAVCPLINSYFFNSCAEFNKYTVGCCRSLGNKFISWCWDNYLSCAKLQCDPSGGAFLR